MNRRFIPSGRERRNTEALPWLDVHLSFTLEAKRSNCVLHATAKLNFFSLLNVLYFPSSKSLLSLCPPSQMLSLQNPLVSGNLSTTTKFFFLLSSRSMHLFIYSFCKQSSTSVLLGAGTGGDKAQKASALFSRGQENQRLNTM